MQVNEKQSVRYLGFECSRDGARRLDFSVDAPSQERRLVSFDIEAAFFAGENRILLQEAAGICYAKLKDILKSDSDLPTPVLLTRNDIFQYRQLPSPRYRTTKHRAT